MVLRLGLTILLTLAAVSSTPHAPQAQACNPQEVTCFPEPSGPTFKIAAYNGTIVRDGGKCLDYEAVMPGAAVTLSDCDVAKPFRVVELKELRDADGLPIRNHVFVFAGHLVLGAKASTVRDRAESGPLPGPVQTPTSAGLELQSPLSKRNAGELFPRNQVFALDGDSIMLASNRSQVVQVFNGRGADDTPVVLGPRTLAEWEFWEFKPTSDAYSDPTDAFVNVSTFEDLMQVLQEASSPFPPSRPATFGTVIRITQSMLVTSLQPLIVPSGVTIRGDRRGTLSGPELWMILPIPGTSIFAVNGHDIRITNLRLRGPNDERDTDGDLGEIQTRGIDVGEPVEFDTSPSRRIYIDNNDIYDFHWNGVRVNGGDPDSNDRCDQFGAQPRWEQRPNHVTVLRNFIHHNLVQDKGYGVNANSGGYPLIFGNTFVSNRHAIAGTNSTPRTGYRAIGNLVLRAVPLQESGPFNYLTHDFDMHGTGDGGFGGIAGGYMDVGSNTFLGLDETILGTHPNFEIRSMPCRFVEFHDNVSLRSEDEAVSIDESLLPINTSVGTEQYVHVAQAPEQFEYSNPTTALGSGDFDGDGVDDLFLATRTAFYYSPGGTANWRLLSIGRTDHIASLRFGDFDGDGRTDVIGKNGANIMVSWGGSAEWETLNQVSAPITDLAVGNFDGGEQDDIFYADGRTWRVSSGGSGTFEQSQTSGFRVSNLRFGDFNGDEQTDVFGIVSGSWSVSYSATSSWTPLRPRLTTTVDRLFVGDFNGDGRDDIGNWEIDVPSLRFEWRFSYDGVGDWVSITSAKTGPLAGWARFRGDMKTDLLFWDPPPPIDPSPSDHVFIAYFGSGGLTRHSGQAMR